MPARFLGHLTATRWQDVAGRIGKNRRASASRAAGVETTLSRVTRVDLASDGGFGGPGNQLVVEEMSAQISLVV